ncbi:MAG: cation:proton antiporter [Actinomycetota bacterium]|nr:cation:proton antiporter [Actinomycetota bacterium]
MAVVLAFAATLLVAVLVSALAHRSVLSTAVLFLLAGLVLGSGALNVIRVRPETPVVSTFAELALFSVLYTDGMRVTFRDLRSGTLPGRALAVGLPITLLLTAVLGRFVAGLPWAEALLLGAVLSPTDPVFAAAIVGRDEVPYRLRHLLNVESGLNDGLALPVVVVLLAVVSGGPVHGPRLAPQLAGGVALGVAIPWVAIRLERLPVLGAASLYEPLTGFALGLLVLSVASITHANEFLAAFAAGITLATLSPGMRAAFHQFGDLIAELLKLAALLLFGALISPSFLRDIPLTGYAFAVLALVVVRPIALACALFRSDLDRREWVAAAWFGPKGFASVVYGLLILESGVSDADRLFHLTAIVIVLSILAHASTDVVVARWFRTDPGEPEVDAIPN